VPVGGGVGVLVGVGVGVGVESCSNIPVIAQLSYTYIVVFGFVKNVIIGLPELIYQFVKWYPESATAAIAYVPATLYIGLPLPSPSTLTE
jgi:hypothetical protein